MARNGSGTYVLATGNPVTNGQTITDTLWNDTFNDVATALTDSISKDGQTTPTANMPMGGYKHTNVANSAYRTDYAKVSQTQDSAYTYLTSVSGVDTITAAAGMSMTAYAAGQMFHFVAAGANTGAVTININSIGAKDVTKNGTTALVAGDIPSGAVVSVLYDGTRFQIQDAAKTYQPLDAELTAIAGLTSAANKVPMFSGSGTATVVDFLDEDNMASDSATAVPSQQSTKAYVDAGVASANSYTDTEVAGANSYTDAQIAALSGGITSATAQNTTSGSNIDFLSIPSGTKRITIMFSGVSTTGTAAPLIRIGDSGGIEATGYSSGSGDDGGVTIETTGINIVRTLLTGDTLYGTVTLSLLDESTNRWVAHGIIYRSGSTTVVCSCAGSKALSGTLDRIRLLTSDTFDAGIVNIMYE